MTHDETVLVWVQNYRTADPDPHGEAFKKGFMSRYYDDSRLVISPPQATAAYTAAELQQRGLVGLYAYRFVRPYVDYRTEGALSKIKSPG